MSAGMGVDELAGELSKWHTASQLAQLLGGSPASIVQAHRAGRPYKKLKLLRRKAKEADYKGGTVDRRVQFLWSIEGDPDVSTLQEILGMAPAPPARNGRSSRGSGRSTPRASSSPAPAATTASQRSGESGDLRQRLTSWHEVSTLAEMIGSSTTSIYNSFRQNSKHRGLTFRRREVDEAEREAMSLHRLTKYLWSVEPGFSDDVLSELKRHLQRRAASAAAPAAAASAAAKERRQARESAPKPSPKAPVASAPASAPKRAAAPSSIATNGSLERLVAAAREVVVTRREDSIEELGRALFSYLGG